MRYNIVIIVESQYEKGTLNIKRTYEWIEIKNFSDPIEVRDYFSREEQKIGQDFVKEKLWIDPEQGRVQFIEQTGKNDVISISAGGLERRNIDSGLELYGGNITVHIIPIEQ